MERKYILAVKPLEPYILQIDFISGSRLLLDMKPYVDKIRFRTLYRPKGVEQRSDKWDLCTFWKCGAEP